MSKPIIIDRTQPNSYITALLKYKTHGKLLDMGAGHGRHAIFFAQNGFDVTAADPDRMLVQEVMDKSKEQNLGITVIQSDIKHFDPDTHCDVIVCAMVLHFMDYQEVLDATHKMQAITAPGGLNVISAYTNKNVGDFMKDNPFGHEKYLLKENELKDMYVGWELLEYSEDWTEPGVINPDDTPTSHHKVNMIARKTG